MPLKARYLFIVLMGLTIYSCVRPVNQALVIAAAANVQFAIDEITEEFTRQTGIPCEIIISSSGKLTAQIMEGAPFDIFISADLTYPQRLYDGGLTANPPLVYARGRLVLWSMSGKIPDNLPALIRPDLTHIAMANPAVAPYGKAAEEALRFYQIYDQVKDKLVYGESIAQVNQFIISRSVAAGFTSKSVVLSPQLKNQGTWIDINPEAYPAIDQGVVALKASTRPEQTQLFIEFLRSDIAAHTFEKYGYDVNLKNGI